MAPNGKKLGFELNFILAEMSPQFWEFHFCEEKAKMCSKCCFGDKLKPEADFEQQSWICPISLYLPKFKIMYFGQNCNYRHFLPQI